ncbi:MAG: nickel pincer cofactor biosynthesis protein LarB [Acidobacteriota bacterium]
MRESELKRLLQDIRGGAVSVREGVRRLRSLPFEDLGFAKVDHHRRLRQGFPEVIYGEGKTDEQVVAIAGRLHAGGAPVLITRTRRSVHEALRGQWPEARFHEAARAIVIPEPGRRRRAGRAGVLVIGAGTSDIPVAEEAALTAELMGNRVERVHDVGVAGLHRLLGHVPAIQEANVLVVVAGMEGALPSVVAGLTPAPVIAVPTSVGYGAGMGGLAALAGMLNSCAAGLVVVNIDNGFGAGYAAGIINLQSRARRHRGGSSGS